MQMQPFKGNIAPFVLFAFVLFIIVGFWWSAHLRQGYNNAIAALEQTGFQVDETLPSEPPVVFDQRQRKLAFISPQGAVVYEYDAIEKVQWVTHESSGWKEKNTPERSYRLLFQVHGQPIIAVNLSQATADLWRNKLEKLLQSQP